NTQLNQAGLAPALLVPPGRSVFIVPGEVTNRHRPPVLMVINWQTKLVVSFKGFQIVPALTETVPDGVGSPTSRPLSTVVVDPGDLNLTIGVWGVQPGFFIFLPVREYGESNVPRLVMKHFSVATFLAVILR